ncbi:dephospho-CoA kinase [Tissierella pigra]|uniref:Dephospho-CoA kinase n=1 Tax=Tissierella pigra TaxID=2607614 RepID=A0A6N7Y0G8_9FIRM|nr:dephospho-CoA kinase [Tissierella pigra]MSU02354.1 dephospho-CoA kinase [Tissierella pigra]
MKQNNCILIGLTGGISSGKSTVSHIIKEKGYPLIDADKIAREVVEINKPAYTEIVKEFGEEILLKNKSINRKELGNIIFMDRISKEKLESIIHPYIFQEIKNEIDKLSIYNPTIFLDIPLLFEQYELWKEYDIKFNEIWVVYLDKATQLDRLMKRDSISKEEALRKMESQMDIEIKKAKSSKTIDNSGDMKFLEKQIDKLLEKLI